MQVLLNAVTSTGNGSAVNMPNDVRYGHPTRTLIAFGTWGGTTLTIQVSADGPNWVTVPNLSITANTASDIDISSEWIRGVLTGGSGMTVTCQLGG